MTEEHRKLLELFNEKASKLHDRAFTAQLTDPGVSLSMNIAVGQPTEANVSVPGDEATEAAMLTFRMFIQDNDSISLRNVGKLTTDEDFSQEWRDHVNWIRGRLNTRLDSATSPIIIKDEDHHYTEREVFETFMYGEYAHTNEAKRERYKKWEADELRFPFIRVQFTMSALQVLSTIFHIANCNHAELAGNKLPTVEEFKNIAGI